MFPIGVTLSEHNGKYDILEARDIKYGRVLIRHVLLIIVLFERLKPEINSNNKLVKGAIVIIVDYDCIVLNEKLSELLLLL